MPNDVAWFFLLTLPNSGSSAVAGLFASAPAALSFGERGEGQWLIPEMSAPGRRWDPAFHPDYEVVRSTWLEEVRRLRPDGPVVVVEKSPPNLVRHRRLVAAFADMPVTVASLTRDPYAVCASWFGRYRPQQVARQWGYDVAHLADEAYLTALAGIWLERSRLILAARPECAVNLRYEDVCADPAGTLAAVAAVVPLLAGADAAVELQVKDNPAQPLRDFNREQIDALPAGHLEAITRGLSADQEVVTALGYRLR